MSEVLIKTKNMDGTALLNQNVQAPCVIEIYTKSRYLKFEVRENGLLKNVVKRPIGKKKRKKIG